jgi:hypothetical protein
LFLLWFLYSFESIPKEIPEPIKSVGKTTVDLVDDFKSRNFEKTANNVIDRVVPKGLSIYLK